MSKINRINKQANDIFKENKKLERINNISIKKSKSTYKLIIIELLIITLIIKTYSYYQIKNKFANITIKIKKTNSGNIFYYKFSTQFYPNKIKINNIEQKNIKNNDFAFDEDINIVELIWENNDINSCKNMFRENQNIIEIDLNNFDITRSTSMWCMFKKCNNLIAVNLTKLDTSNIEQMNGLFHFCSSLTSIDLSNFNTSKVTMIDYMFSDCINLEYINIKNFNNNSLTIYHNFFDNLPENVIICINKENMKNVLNQLENKTCYSIDCSNTWRKKQKKLIDKTNSCVDSCSNEIQYKYEYNGKCYENCINTINNENIDICNYYFDDTDNLFKECYSTCKTCKMGGTITNNNCDECKNGYILLDEPNNKNNCFKCNYYYYIDRLNNLFCTDDFSCPKKHDKFIFEKRKCINLCQNDNRYKLEYNGSCVMDCPNGTFIYNNKFCQEYNKSKANMNEQASSNFYTGVLSGEVDFSNLTGNSSLYTEKISDDLTMSAGTTEALKNSIDLGNCVDELKQYYNISKSQSLILIKSNFSSNYSLVSKVGYDLIDPTSSSILNLSYCNTTEDKLYLPVIINENIKFIYDPNSDYYNDNCFSYTTENGTDIILKDRQKEFINKNLSLCDNNCVYIDYDSINKQSICTCDIRNKAKTITELMNSQNQVPDEFISNEESKSSSSVLSIKCMNALFTSNALKTNYLSYILLYIIFYFLISIIFFIKCGFNILKNEINKIIKKKENESAKKKRNQIKDRRRTLFNNNQNNMNMNINKIKNYPPRKSEIRFMSTDNQGKHYQRVPRSSMQNMNNHKLLTKFIGDNSQSGMNDKKETKEKKISKNKNRLKSKKNLKINLIKYKFKDYEINTMNYQEAILYDNRSCFEYYLSLIKTKHPLIFAFCPTKDYNIIIIKSCIFFLSFAICFAINFIFIDEKIIHKIYEEGGKYNIIFFLQKIGISFIIFHIITIFIKLIFLSERNILEIKKQKKLTVANDIKDKVIKKLKIKYIFFFLLGIIFLWVFWLFLSSFSAVYKNTQIILIKNTLISFAISLIYPFFINIFPCLLRIISLSGKNRNLGCIYNSSKFFQLL